MNLGLIPLCSESLSEDDSLLPTHTPALSMGMMVAKPNTRVPGETHSRLDGSSVLIHETHLGHPGYIKGTFLGWALLQAPGMLISAALIWHFQQRSELADGDAWEWQSWEALKGFIFSLRLSKFQHEKHAKNILTLNHSEVSSKRLDLQKASCKQRQPLVISITSILRSLLRSAVHEVGALLAKPNA